MNNILLVVVAGLAAFIPRYFPTVFFSKRKLPEWFDEWMSFVPVSLFTALIAKSIFVTSTYGFVATNIAAIVAAILVIIIAYYTHSMAISVVSGLILMWILKLFL